MSTANLERIIDGDGHIMEDLVGIVSYMPEEFRGKSFAGGERVRSPFPPIDHLHSANRHVTPPGSFANVGPDGWLEFLDEVGVDSTVLYTTSGLGFGKIVSRDWAVMLAQAYNNWVYDTYLSPRRSVPGDGPAALARAASGGGGAAADGGGPGVRRGDAPIDRRPAAAFGR